MKAVICDQPGSIGDLRVGELPDPEPGEGEIVIDVAAAGINYLDALMAQGKYQTKPEPPFVPGCEVSGTVRSIGPGVADFAPGDRVAAFCRIGGYATQVCTAATNCFALPDGVRHVDAAGFPIVYGTSWHALKDRARMQAGETLLVLGAAGGVGLTAVELGKALGARVIAAASSDEKRALAREYGADEVLDYSDGDLRKKVKAMTGGKGADVIYDPVGGDLGEQAFKSVAWEGRYLVIGFASGPIPSLPANYLLLKSASAVGVYWGDMMAADPDGQKANMADLFARLGRGELKPHIGDTYPLDDAVAAVQSVADRKARGKVILTTGENA